MNLVGEGAIVTGVLPDVFPVVDVENLATDNWALSGWRTAMGGGSVGAAAGQRPHVQILNPGGSGNIAVVEMVMVSTNSSDLLEFNIHDAVLTTPATSPRWRDRRFPTLNFPVTQVRQQSIVGTPIVSPMAQNVLSGQPWIWQPPQGILVLAPGTGFAISRLTVATALRAVFFWRERPADPAELNISG